MTATQLRNPREATLYQARKIISIAVYAIILLAIVVTGTWAALPGLLIIAALIGGGMALMVLHSPSDDTVGIEHATEIFRAAEHPKSFVSLDTADHLLSDADDARFAGEMIASWTRRYIGIPR